MKTYKVLIFEDSLDDSGPSFADTANSHAVPLNRAAADGFKLVGFSAVPIIKDGNDSCVVCETRAIQTYYVMEKSE